MNVSSTYKSIIIWKINSKYVTGFRKSFGTQHSLMIILEKWKNVLDKGEYICVLFMDLSEVFDTINHDLLLAK